MKLSVIIVSYNVKYYLGQCLEALTKAIDNLDAEIFVIDNHSNDDSMEYLQERFSHVNFIRCNHNYGFACANNIAIRQSDSSYVLLLNPDTIVGEKTITDCLQFMDEHSQTGVLGVRMLNTDGTDAKESRRGLPSPLTAFYKMSGLCARYPYSHRFGKYYMSYLSWDSPAQIDVVSGAFCMLRRSALDKVGLLDEDYFMYGEDIDLSYRLLKGGYQNWYFPSKILHYKGESTQKSSFKYVHVFYEAMLIFFSKHYAHMSLILSLPIKLAIYFKASLSLVSMLMDKARKSMGFSGYHLVQSKYVFIGREDAIDVCRKLARAKGLDAQFVVGDETSLPDGHLGFLQQSTKTFVVYDVDAYRFDTIFDIFSRRPMSNVYIGTFNLHSKTIITGEEVLR